MPFQVKTLFLLSIGFFLCSKALAQPQNGPCEQIPVYADFDFWIGEWEVRTPSDSLAGTNIITKEEQNCVLIEKWTSAAGTTGQSVNYFDPKARAWKQLWVDTFGNVIELSGGFSDGAMRLTGTLVNYQGDESLLRGTWTPLEDGRVRQLFEQSIDQGATWTIWFDGYYTR